MPAEGRRDVNWFFHLLYAQNCRGGADMAAPAGWTCMTWITVTVACLFHYLPPHRYHLPYASLLCETTRACCAAMEPPLRMTRFWTNLPSPRRHLFTHYPTTRTRCGDILLRSAVPRRARHATHIAYASGSDIMDTTFGW